MALQIAGIKNIVIVQNKIDLVSDEDALANYNAIREFLKDTQYANAPIIPLSAAHNVNVDALAEAIQTFIPTPKRNQDLDPIMFIARSFDINKPGILPENMLRVSARKLYGDKFSQSGFYRHPSKSAYPSYKS